MNHINHAHSKQLWHFAIEYRHALMLLLLLVASNWLSHSLTDDPSPPSREPEAVYAPAASSKLFLLDDAAQFTINVKEFENKVREVAGKLAIPPDWLMAVMHAESSFDASVSNKKGSGATGLIQWMPQTIAGYHITTDQLRNLNHVQQLDFAYRYLDDQRKRHGGYRSLTDLYLAILYPSALNKPHCHVLYANPSRAYKMNGGLDQNKDGAVTVGDIDQLLKRKYRPAYAAAPPQNQSVWKRFAAGFGWGD